MPNRILREGILSSDKVNALSFGGEVFYRRLMSVVDDFGRCTARATLLRSKCYPLRIDCIADSDIEKWLAECIKADLLLSYVVDSKPYIEVRDFRQQTRAKRSKYPAPLGNSTCYAHAQHMRSTCATDAQHMRSDTDTDTDTESDTRSAPVEKSPLQLMEDCASAGLVPVSAILPEVVSGNSKQPINPFDWPKTKAAITKYTAVDDRILGEIAMNARGASSQVTDAELALAVHACVPEGYEVRTAGFFLKAAADLIGLPRPYSYIKTFCDGDVSIETRRDLADGLINGGELPADALRCVKLWLEMGK